MEYDLEKIFDIIESSQIPDIQLYMDQITTFMDERLKQYKRNETDKIITKTMINNYTKDKILPPPEKKKYSPQQLMLLIIIFHLKPVLSISDIGKLLNSPPAKNAQTRDLYTMFLEIQKIERDTADESLNTMYASIDALTEQLGIDPDEDIRVLLAALFLSLDASYKKSLVEQIIDKYLSNTKA